MSAAEERAKTAAVVARDGALPMPVGPGPLPLSAEQLAAIDALAAAATPGPWWTERLAEHDGSESTGVDAGGDNWVVPCQDLDPADAEFIAHSRTDVPVLLAEVDRLRGLSDHLRESRNRFRDQRNGVFDTNRKLLAELELEQVARLLAENESRTQARESAALRARVAELEAERALTDVQSAAMWDAVDEATPGYIFKYEYQRIVRAAFAAVGIPLVGADEDDEDEPEGPSVDVSADKLTRLLAPTQALREDPHDSPLHHDYRVPRDLPESGGA